MEIIEKEVKSPLLQNFPLNPLKHIFAFLDVVEIFRLARLCKCFKELIFDSSYRWAQSIWINSCSVQAKNSKNCLQALKNCILIAEIRVMTIIDIPSQFPWESVLDLVASASSNLQTLSISSRKSASSDAVKGDALIRCLRRYCPKLTSLTLSGILIGEESLQLLAQLTNLEELRLVYDDPFFEGLYLPELRKIRQAELHPHLIRPDILCTFAAINCASLQSLTLDCENLSEKDMLQIFTQLNPEIVTCYQLMFAENAGAELIECLALFKHVEVITFRKNYILHGSDYCRLVSGYSAIKRCNFEDCRGFNDDALLLLGKTSGISLEILNVSWCPDLSDAGIAMIMDNCPRIRKLNLKGLKKLTELSFGRFAQAITPQLTGEVVKSTRSDQNLFVKPIRNADYQFAYFQNLKKINLTKSDFVSDRILWAIRRIFPWIKIKDYYGEYLE